MRKNPILPIVICLIFVLTNCEKNDLIHEDISKTVNISFIESLKDGETGFMIGFMSTQYIPCLYDGHFLLSYNPEQEPFYFYLKGIIYPKDCNDGQGLASTNVMLGKLLNKTYNITIDIGHEQSKGIIYISDTTYSLKLEKPGNAKVVRGDYRRIPKNTLWVGMGYCSADYTTIANSFVDSLKMYGAVPVLLKDGNYSFFMIENGIMNPLVDLYFPCLDYKYGYVFSYNFDDQKIGQLVDSYKKYSQNGFYIRVGTTNGSRFFNYR
jgi:hypothetical protein